jgi:hypothetical protein
MARSLEKTPKNPFKKLIIPHLQLNVVVTGKRNNQPNLNQMAVSNDFLSKQINVVTRKSRHSQGKYQTDEIVKV